MKVISVIAVLVALTGLSLGFSVPLVYAHGGDPTMIHTCVNNSSGAVKFIAANGSCHNNETPVDWDKAARTEPGTFTVDCDAAQTIQAALKDLIPGDTLLVSGTCNENVVVEEHVQNITLDGQGSATINSPDATKRTVDIRGRGITIKGSTVTGGSNGIFVSDGGTVSIDGNIIQGNGSDGIQVARHSFAQIVNNTIQSNAGDGIRINDHSNGRIGFVTGSDTVASPNTIQMNGGSGISVLRSSNARIVGNTISNNSRGGVSVSRVSSGDLSSNTIDSNTGDGIVVTQNSGVNLGNDSGTGIFDLPNSTTANNTGVGIKCRINSYADGRLGSLNGTGGATNFDTTTATPNGGCVNSTIP
jgi:parallel beta-helix repeat protein